MQNDGKCNVASNNKDNLKSTKTGLNQHLPPKLPRVDILSSWSKVLSSRPALGIHIRSYEELNQPHLQNTVKHLLLQPTKWFGGNKKHFCQLVICFRK